MKQTLISPRLSRGTILLVLCAMLTVGQPDSVRAAEQPPAITQEQREEAWLRMFDVYNLILDEYDGRITPEELSQTAIDAMIRKLDRFSEYLSPQEVEEFNAQIEQNFTGVGIVVEKVKTGLHIKRVLPDSPAAGVGLQAGDVITMVDGSPIANLSLEEAASRIRGPEGTKVDLIFTRPGVQGIQRRIIERSRVKAPNVEQRMIEDGIGYIRISSFSRSSGGEFRIALDQLLEQDMRGLVLDLRDNGGGYLSSGIDVARELVPEGPVVHIKTSGGPVTTINALPRERNFPVAVLIDGGTASASEIVAGAVQDRGSGILVGTRTYGKGSVQTLYDVEDGSVIKLTTAHYLTPSMRSIDGEGLQPDIEIVLPGLPVNEASDLQLQAALDWLRSQDGISR